MYAANSVTRVSNRLVTESLKKLPCSKLVEAVDACSIFCVSPRLYYGKIRSVDWTICGLRSANIYFPYRISFPDLLCHCQAECN